MVGLGTIVNSLAIIAGGLFGYFFGTHIKESMQNTLIMVCGISTMFIAIGGALEGMLTVEGGMISSGRGVFIVVMLVLGAIIGELLNIEDAMEKFGEWLKKKTGNARDKQFVDAFLTATFTVCIGAMAVVGSIEDGIYGDYSILFTKSILDLIIIIVMAAALGKGAIFSFIPVAIFQGSITICARLIQPILTDASLGNLSMIGSILIFCVGVNLVWGKKVKVANLLPSIVLAVAAAFLPFSIG